MEKDSKIYIAGHQGMAGSAIARRLQADGFENLICRAHGELDLTDQAAVNVFFERKKPDCVFLAAAKVGGIHANSTYPADFILANLQIQTNVIEAARRNGAKKLVFLGSSCIYPRLAPQPIPESALLTGPLEPTNEWYAVAKIAGLKLCQALRRQYGFNAISVMPTNLYGPGDNFHPENSHVLPALIRRFLEAKEKDSPEVVVWGSGQPRREFLHIDDFADAAVFLMESYDGEEIINIGTGTDITIRQLAELVGDVAGYEGSIGFDPAKPDGVPRKLLDTSRLNALGWFPKISLRDGIRTTYTWFQENQADFRA